MLFLLILITRCDLDVNKNYGKYPIVGCESCVRATSNRQARSFDLLRSFNDSIFDYSGVEFRFFVKKKHKTHIHTTFHCKMHQVNEFY